MSAARSRGFIFSIIAAMVFLSSSKRFALIEPEISTRKTDVIPSSCEEKGDQAPTCTGWFPTVAVIFPAGPGSAILPASSHRSAYTVSEGYSRNACLTRRVAGTAAGLQPADSRKRKNKKHAKEVRKVRSLFLFPIGNSPRRKEQTETCFPPFQCGRRH